MKKKIGIIGYGNMGSAIAERGKTGYDILVFDKDAAKLGDLAGLVVAASVADLAARSEVLILAVKPQDFEPVLEELSAGTAGKLVITIAAGIPTQYLEGRLKSARVVRVMPNLPAKIGQGMSCLCKGKTATDEDIKFAQGLFDKLGKTAVIKEEMMDAATAVSGSGPGFLCDLIKDKPEQEWERFGEDVFIPKMSAAAQEKAGFSEDEAYLLSRVTTSGTISLLKVMRVKPEILRNQVTSKRGTTEAGLVALQGSIDHLPDAVEAALKRARELSKKE